MSTKIGIIGAGPGGYIAAIRAAQLGAQVVVIEQEALGGTCLNWGCIPTKTLKTTAEALEQLHRARELGIDLEGGFRPNIERIMARKNAVVALLAQGIQKIFESYKIQFLKGRALIRDPRNIVVTGPSGDLQEINVDQIIIASGSQPLEFPAFPFDGHHILSSSDALLLKEIPESLLIIGGGVIGCEFAFIFRLLGSQVTVVEALPRVIGLPSIDPDCSTIIQREMKKRKINLLLDKTVEKTEVQNGRVRATLGPSPFLKEVKDKDRQPIEMDAGKVLVTIGRQSNAAALGLAKLGMELDEKGWIRADSYLKTNIPGIYAIGDALGPSKIMLAHVASTEGIIAAESIMGHPREMSYDVVPSAIFTFPEVSAVGLTEFQARERGHEVRSSSFLFRTLGKPQAMGEIVGQAKIVSDQGTGKILGVHIAGPHATDLIAEGTLAMQLGATVEALARTIHAHPTLAEVLLETAHKAMGSALHGLKEP
ncbi:MAG TPA: dihydrolipoyl dehydrogenase [Thermodesulfobacteriota bacterium]|nr:dihydrolipoyl dehydrogenase [Thermodesulfobacteriota bacterium]